MKTDISGNYNEDNFVQKNNSLEELTVTITLCEYRNLVADLVYAEKNIERLNDEIKRIKEEKETMAKIILKNKKDLLEKLLDDAKAFYGETEESEE